MDHCCQVGAICVKGICSRCVRQRGETCGDGPLSFGGERCCEHEVCNFTVTSGQYGYCGEYLGEYNISNHVPRKKINKPQWYNGIYYPDGDKAFADEVFEYYPGPSAGMPFNQSFSVLGPPWYTRSPWGNGGREYDMTSLGNGGHIVLFFKDNFLAASGDNRSDLHITETGGLVEEIDVYIRRDEPKLTAEMEEGKQ